ncbi:hypothetical protein IAQ61_002884 [Plenodomus lingam]|uniref:uncharacterized protein n=1 Tax=Leptosphaeria maculans TaxID=5022 RepID=UPI00332E5BFF|nr:hypothetical protein IAQ61_002884 [Plenodomus lingam]
MGDATIMRLSATPWAASLINSPEWTIAETPSRVLKPTGEDSFFAETLSTDRTMRTCLTLRPAQAVDDHWPYQKIVTLVEIGEGLNGYPNIIHGGMAATLLDEVSGVLLQINTAAQLERMKRQNPSGSHVQPSYFTACTSYETRNMNASVLTYDRPEYILPLTGTYSWRYTLHCQIGTNRGQKGLAASYY